MKHCSSARVKTIALHQNSALSPVCFLRSLSPVNNLYVDNILLQLPLGSNTISLQFHNCNRQSWMSCRSGRTTCSSTVRLVSNGWYSWGGEKDAGNLNFCIAIDAWRVYWCFRSLYIADILWNIIQASLGSLCEARVFTKLDTFTNPVRLLFFSVFMIILHFIHLLD